VLLIGADCRAFMRPDDDGGHDYANYCKRCRRTHGGTPLPAPRHSGMNAVQRVGRGVDVQLARTQDVAESPFEIVVAVVHRFRSS
jgi:hypothetical protein